LFYDKPPVKLKVALFEGNVVLAKGLVDFVILLLLKME